MRKKWIAVVLAVCLCCGISACGKTPAPPPAPGPSDGQTQTMPTFADITVTELREKPIAVDAAETFTYTFDGNNIAIENGVVRGLVADTSTKVTAKADYGEASFTVSVAAALGGFGEASAAFARSGDGFIKTATAYGEAYCYLDGQPLNRDGLIASGTLQFSAIGADAEARVLFSGTNSRVYLRILPSASGITVKGVAGEDERMIGSYSHTRVHFLTFVSEGIGFFYLNDSLIWKTAVAADAQLGFGSQNATVKITRLTTAYHAAFVAALKNEAFKPFGEHAYGARSNDTGTFVDIGNGAYKKFSYSYSNQWLYDRGEPVCGVDFTVRGTLEMLTPDSNAQAMLLCCNRQNKLMRILLSYDKPNNRYFIESGYEANGGFPGYQIHKIGVDSKIDFTFTYRNGVGTFRIGDETIATLNSLNVREVGDLGAVHFGFAGMNCQMVVSNLTAEIG